MKYVNKKMLGASSVNVALLAAFLGPMPSTVQAQSCTYTGDKSNPAAIANWINNSACPVVNLSGNFIAPGAYDNEIKIERSNVTIRGGTTKKNTNAIIKNMAFRIEASDVTLEYFRFLSNGDKNAEAITIGDDCTTYTNANTACDNNSAVSSRNIIQNNFFNGFYQTSGGGQIIRIAPSLRHSHNHNEIRNNEFYNWGGDASAGNSRAIQVGYQRLNASAGTGHTPWKLTIGTKIVNNVFVHNKAWVWKGANNSLTPARGTASIQLNNPTVVENNCVVGGANGISAKGSYNTVVGNTVLRTRQDGALYMRDGDHNLFAHNIVKSNSGRGLYAWSGRGNVFIRNVFNTNGALSSEYDNGNFYAQGQIVQKNDEGDRKVGDPTGRPYSNGVLAVNSNNETSYKLRSLDLLITRNRFVNSVHKGGAIDIRGTQSGDPQGANLRSNRVDDVLTAPGDLVNRGYSSSPPNVYGSTTPINSPAANFMLNNWTRAKHHKWSDFDNQNHRPKDWWFTINYIPYASNANVGFDENRLGATYVAVPKPCK